MLFSLVITIYAHHTRLDNNILHAEPPANSSSTPSATKSDLSKTDIVSLEAIKRHIEFLASPQLEGRGTPRGKQLARDYILAQFQAAKLEPLFAENHFLQPIPGPADADGQPTVLGQNVGALLRGSDASLRNEYLVICAHYDHLGIRGKQLYPGAADNAAGVALLLETARVLSLQKEKLRRSILFLSFDLEEHLLFGSRWFVAHPPVPLSQIKLCLTADILGRTLGDLPLPTIFVMGSEHAPGLKEMVTQQHRRVVPPPAQPTSSPPAAAAPADKTTKSEFIPGTLPENHNSLQPTFLGADLVGTRSDYGPFRDAKIPFLFFSSGQYPDYHTPRDVAERVDHRQVVWVTQLVAGMCDEWSRRPQIPSWIPQPAHGLDDVHALARITQLLLEQDQKATIPGVGKLTQTQRFLVTSVQQKTTQLIQKGMVTEDDRAWLIRSAQFLLWNIF